MGVATIASVGERGERRRVRGDDLLVSWKARYDAGNFGNVHKGKIMYFGPQMAAAVIQSLNQRC